MNNIVNKITLLFLSLITCSTSYAASFDCTKANASYEKTICTDDVLNRLDEALSNNYHIAMNSTNPQKVRDLLKHSQIVWLNKRNACSEYSCIRNLYEGRVDEICKQYVSSTKKLNCISTQDASMQINKERDIAKQKERDLAKQEERDIAKREERDIVKQKEREFAKQEDQKNRIPVKEVFQNLVKKHSNEVSQLGFSKAQLSSYIYISMSFNYSRYCTLQEYLSLMVDIPGLKSISKIDDGEYFGFRMKVAGKPTTGFTFHVDDDELYLNGLVSGGDIVQAVTARQANQITSPFYLYAVQILDKNNAKL